MANYVPATPHEVMDDYIQVRSLLGFLVWRLGGRKGIRFTVEEYEAEIQEVINDIGKSKLLFEVDITPTDIIMRFLDNNTTARPGVVYIKQEEEEDAETDRL
jgi:hypothetical protein